MNNQLSIPKFFDETKVDQVFRVPYEQRMQEALKWSKEYGISPASQDGKKVGLLLIDVQNTFCLPEFELFVAGKSGRGAIEDNKRLCQFVYKNLNEITDIIVTMDTHKGMQVFHSLFLVDDAGNHPAPATSISLDDVLSGKWKVNPEVSSSYGYQSVELLQDHLVGYCKKLKQGGKFELMIWPYHAMLGGIGHSLVSCVEEAVFFHTIARQNQAHIELKGFHPMTENYSVISPEFEVEDHVGVNKKNNALIQKLLKYDRLYIAGQAQSHCVAWTVIDLLNEIQLIDPKLAQKVYLLEDCTSPVVIKDVMDFSEDAEKEFARFHAAGMNLVSVV